MTLLCNDCQRHSTYEGQYRAMFVMNCRIEEQQNVVVKISKKKTLFKRHRKRASSSDVTSSAVANDDDVFQSVKCSECSTEVACIDKDEVFHFFNVIESR